MAKLKVNVIIGGRRYPLSVENTQEEEGLRLAAKKINTLMAQYEENYEVSDKQDVLAMCALQFASKSEISSLQEKQNDKIAEDTINELIELVDKHLE